MARIDYDRYSLVRNNGIIEQLPFIKLDVKPSDRYITWNDGFSRLDIISEEEYQNPYYDFLILMANPEYISEFDIPDNTIIRIPYPLDSTLAEYNTKLKQKLSR